MRHASRQATYVLTSENEVEMDFEAHVEGKACPVALTNHAYYNLSGGLSRKVTDGHLLRVQAQRVLELGENMVGQWSGSRGIDRIT